MSKRLINSFIAVVLVLAAGSGQARVTGLPDFTELVEQSVPAVVNIRVTQFGDRVRPESGSADNPHDMEEIP